jgi:hypothetical protein
MFKEVGSFWNNADYIVISDGTEFFVIERFPKNGETHCGWRVLDNRGYERPEHDEKEYAFKAVSEEHFDEAGDLVDSAILGYELW